MMPMPVLPAITLLSLLHFFGTIAWCGGILAAAMGYAGLPLRLLLGRRPGLAMAGSAGIGVLILIGGLLNLLQAITVPVLLGTVVVGLASGVGTWMLGGGDRMPASVHGDTQTSTLATKLLLVGFGLFLAFRLGASVHTVYYQPSDDYNFYLAEPLKMLQTHHFAADPFSERRIMSSLGGNHFLEVLVLSVFDLEDIQMADRAVGLLLTAFLAFAIGRQFRLTRNQTAALALFFLATTQLQFNLTFVILPSAMFFGLAYLGGASEDELRGRPTLQGLLLGLAGGAAATMKSTYVVHAVVFLACMLLVYAVSRGMASAARTAGGAAVGMLLVMLPWMVANHAASGTFFYPSLGPGYHYSAYHLYAPPSGGAFSAVIKKVLPFNAPLILIFLAEWRWGGKDEQSRSAMALAATAALASILVGIATGGDSVRRYNYPCILPAVLMAFPVFCRRANGEARVPLGNALKYGSAALAAGAALYVGFNSFTHEYHWAWRCLRTGVTDFRIEPADVREEYAAMEAAIPRDGKVLETLNYSFLLDFGARDIYMADMPGGASLPSGWPARQPGDALAKYLLDHGIRYLAYSYGDSASQPDEATLHQMNDTGATVWIRTEAEIVHGAHQQYRELAGSRRHLFDDGRIYVLDLASPIAGK